MIETPVHQEILFFDDFMHQTVDRVQWDHIKFNHPVYLDQIRIVPKDCYISLKNGTNRFGRTCPNNFKLEFYANNLNKKEEERATLVKIGSLLYNDEDLDQNASNDLSNFILKPQSIPMDWLVIVGSYLSLSIALIGVKAKQSSTPSLNSSSSNQLVNQPALLSLPPTSSQQQQQQMIPNSVPPTGLINPDNNPYSIRGPNPQIIQQANILGPPPSLTQQQSHTMTPLLPTPLLPISSNLNHHQQQQHQSSHHHAHHMHQQPGQQQQTANDFQSHHSGFINQPNFQLNNNNRSAIHQMGPPSTSQFNNFSPQLVPHQPNQQIRSLSQQPRNQEMNIQHKNNIPQRPNQYQYRMQLNNTPHHPTINMNNIPQHRVTNVCNSNETSLITQQTDSVASLQIETSNSNATSSGQKNIQSLSPVTSIQELSQQQNEPINEESNITETNLSYYLDLDENKDELEIVSSTKLLNSSELLKETKNSSSVLDDFISEQIEQIDFSVKNLKAIKNPILTKYEQEMKENSKFELNKNEKKLFNYLTQNDLFKNLFEDSENQFKTDDKYLNLIEKLAINFTKSNSLFFHLFGSNPNRLNKLNNLIIHSIVSNDLSTKNKKDWSFKIKEFKLGIKLANLMLTRYDKSIFKSLIDLKLQERLIDIIQLNTSIDSSDDDFINEPMRLKCLNTLNNSIQLKYGMEHFVANSNQSRLLDYFLSLKQSTSKSRLIVSMTQILTNCKFYESLRLFSFKCKEKFIQKSPQNQLNFEQEVLNVFEYIYIYCLRNLKLNKSLILAELKKNENQTYDVNESEPDEEQNKLNKKLKPNDYCELPNDSVDLIQYEYLYSDEFETKFNKLPLQNLFDKFPRDFIASMESIRTQSTHNTIIRWCDSFEILKYILMLKSYIYDQLKLASKNKRLVYLNDLTDKFLNDLFNVSELNGFSFVGVEYLLNNPRLTKCLVKIMAERNLNKSENIFKLKCSLNAVSLIGILIYNLEQLTQENDTTQIELILLESVDTMQTLSFLLNPNTANYNLTLVECLCSSDGNMSNKYTFNLLNWLELVIVEKHFNSIVTNNCENDNANNIRYFMLNSLIEIFYILCKSNKNWNLPYFCNETADSSLILVMNKSNKDDEYILNDYRLCLKRLNQYSSLLINSFTAIRMKAQESSIPSNTLSSLIYKLKTIKSFIEPISITTSFNLTNNLKTAKNKLASNLANMSSYYYKINYLNSFIDLFKRTIDKNLNLYFLKQYFNALDSDFFSENESQQKKITIDYLNSNITILNILKNVVTFQSIEINLFDLFHKSKSNQSFNTNLHIASLNLAKYSLDLNEQFNSKRYLGHLISRNFLLICLNLISKLTDYLLFYTKPNPLQQQEQQSMLIESSFSTLSLDLEQFNIIISLVEPVFHLIRTILCKLIKIRNENFTDLSSLPILFRFYCIFNFCMQKSLKNLKKIYSSTLKSSSLKQNRLLLSNLINRFNLINTNLTDIFISFTQPILLVQNRVTIKTSLYSSLFRELARFITEKPFNYYYGLKLLSELLPLPLPIPVKALNEQATNGVGAEEDAILLNERQILSEYLEPLFEKIKPKKINLFDIDVNHEKYAPTFISMFKALSICSNHSKVNKLLKRISVQISDLSDKMCTILLKCLLDYAIKLFGMLKDDNFENDEENHDNDTKHNYETSFIEDKQTEHFVEDQDEPIEDNDSKEISLHNTISNQELIRNENEKINGLINEINDNYVHNGADMGNKENEIDSLYDTENLIDDAFRIQTNENFQKANEHQVLLNDLNTDNEINKINDETGKTSTETEEKAVDTELKKNYKAVITASFSYLMKFICSLLAIEREGCDLNPIRVKFIHLLTENLTHKSNPSQRQPRIKNIYLKFIHDCVKYCNQLDLNSVSKKEEQTNGDLNESKLLIQECLFGLIESLIRFTPELFTSNFKLRMFFYDDVTSNELINNDDENINCDENSLENEQNNELFSRLILNQIQKTLIDHLSLTKLDSLSNSSCVLTSLTMLSKLYKKYLSRINIESVEKDKEYSTNLILINPILKKHLTEINSKSLSNFIRELDNVFQQNSVQFIDLLSKFFIYVNSLIENLVVDKRLFSITSRKIKDLFEWHNSKFNIIGLQIDTISISASLKNKPNNENSLDNLLILIVNTERSNQETNHVEKIDFCSNQTKHLVNILNEVAATNNQNLTNESILNRLEAKFQLHVSNSIKKIPSKTDFQTYFAKRQVFSNKFVKEDFNKYEMEWVNENTDFDDTESFICDDDAEFDLDNNLKNLFKDESDFNATIFNDKNLNKQLTHNLEQSNLEELFFENITNLNSLTNRFEKQTEDNLMDSDSMVSTLKSKNPDVINTRTGLRYKAPMRGGHSNPATRHLISNGASTSHLAANIVNSANNITTLIPSTILLPPSVGSLNNGLVNNNANQASRHDSFRARAPNTSRPASLHVDEFYRLENAKQQQMISNNMNQMTESSVNNEAVLQSNELNKNEFTGDKSNNSSIIKPQLIKIESNPQKMNVHLNPNQISNNNQNNNLNYLKNDEMINTNRNTLRKSNSFISSEDLIIDNNINSNNDNSDHFNRNNMNNNSNSSRFNFAANNNNSNNNGNYNFANTRERSFSSGNLSSFNSGPISSMNSNQSPNNNNASNNNDMFINQMPPPSIIPALLPTNTIIHGHAMNGNNSQNQQQPLPQQQQNQQQQQQQQGNLLRFTRVQVSTYNNRNINQNMGFINNNNNRINEEININIDNNTNSNDLNYENLMSPSPISPKILTSAPPPLIQLSPMNMNIPPPTANQGPNQIQIMPLINPPGMTSPMIQQQNIRLNSTMRGGSGGYRGRRGHPNNNFARPPY